MLNSTNSKPQCKQSWQITYVVKILEKKKIQIVLQMYETAPLVKDGKDACLSDMGTRGCATEDTQNCRKALHSSWLNCSP